MLSGSFSETVEHFCDMMLTALGIYYFLQTDSIIFWLKRNYAYKLQSSNPKLFQTLYLFKLNFAKHYNCGADIITM